VSKHRKFILGGTAPTMVGAKSKVKTICVGTSRLKKRVFLLWITYGCTMGIRKGEIVSLET